MDASPPPEDLTATFGTFLGGSAWERIQGVFVDGAGMIYVVGQTHSADFPATQGAFDTTKSGPSGNGNQLDRADGFVAKLSPDGSQILWATLLGGSRRDAAYGVRTDSFGDVYVVGSTGSDDFPTTVGAYDPTFNGPTRSNGLTDAFVAKLSADGSQLLWSTYVGGAAATEENPRASLLIDETRGRIYMAGTTVGGTDFPTTTNAFQPNYGGGHADAFVLALSLDGSALLHSTFIGGAGSDMGFTSLAAHPDGSIYVAGATSSADFPTTTGAFQQSIASGSPDDLWYVDGDAFLVRIQPDLDQLVFATYFGGDGGDSTSHNQGLAIDTSGRAVLVGFTQSSDLPTTSGAFRETPIGQQDGFVTIFSEDGSTLVSSTYLGGSLDDEFAGVSVGAVGRIAITGATNSTDWPTTSTAHQLQHGGRSDSFLTVFNSSLSKLTYSTYLGGNGSNSGGERGRGTWVGPNGGIVVVGTTDSANFPIVAPSPQGTFGGDQDGFIVGFGYE